MKFFKSINFIKNLSQDNLNDYENIDEDLLKAKLIKSIVFSVVFLLIFIILFQIYMIY